VKKVAQRESNIGPDGKKFRAQHIRLSMKVFINPAVASLPQHAHLFPELGCFVKRQEGVLIHRECGTGPGAALESKLPASFLPLVLDEEMDEKWMTLLRQKLNMTVAGTVS
jgi:hypothetical protein